MATLFLIRHSEPEITGVLLGQMDPPLSIAGRLQARADLSSIQVGTAYSSPLRRAYETAGFLQARHVVNLQDLREIDQGRWTGKTWAEVEAGWPDLALRKSQDWLGVDAPQGESWARFLNRVSAAWQLIRRPEPVAVVAHQGVNAALRYLIDGSEPIAFAQKYGEVITLEYD